MEKSRIYGKTIRIFFMDVLKHRYKGMSFRLRFGIRAACMNGGLNKELSRLGCSLGVRMPPPPLEKPTKTQQYASIIIYIDPIKNAGILRIKGSTVIQKKNSQ